MEKLLITILCFCSVLKCYHCYVVKRSDNSRFNHQTPSQKRDSLEITDTEESLGKPTKGRLTTRNPAGITTGIPVNGKSYSKQATLIVCIWFIPGIAFFFLCCRYVPDWCADRFE